MHGIRPVDLDTWPEQGRYWFQMAPGREVHKFGPGCTRNIWSAEHDLIIEAVCWQLRFGQQIPWEYARYAHEIIKAGILSGKQTFKR